jgi:hypothetical protein
VRPPWPCVPTTRKKIIHISFLLPSSPPPTSLSLTGGGGSSLSGYKSRNGPLLATKGHSSQGVHPAGCEEAALQLTERRDTGPRGGGSARALNDVEHGPGQHMNTLYENEHVVSHSNYRNTANLSWLTVIENSMYTEGMWVHHILDSPSPHACVHADACIMYL